MIVTEQEAELIRCQESFGRIYVTRRGGEEHIPFVTAISVGPGSGVYAAIASRPELPTVASPSHCVGSRCMAWRWHDCGDGWGSAPTGYCGKAGHL